MDEQTINELNGLYLHGTVGNRSRRFVDTKGGKKEVITYKILTEKRDFYVDEWIPEIYHKVGEHVELNVSVRAYVAKNGTVNVSYNVNTYVEFGESF